MRDETKRNLRVGALTVAALVLLSVAVLTIGKRQHEIPIASGELNDFEPGRRAGGPGAPTFSVGSRAFSALAVSS